MCIHMKSDWLGSKQPYLAEFSNCWRRLSQEECYHVLFLVNQF